MADSKLTIMENIFREMITVIGIEKALEIVQSTKTKPAVEEKPKKEEEKKKRIPRMSPTLANQLKTEFGKAYPEDDKKIKKEFVSYVDDLTEDDFTAKNLAEHMRDFVNTKKPKEEKPKEEKPKEEKPKEEKPKKSKKVTVTKEVPKEIEPPSNAANITDVNLEDLQAIEMVMTPSGDFKGILWDCDNGRFVRGPEEEDEDVDPIMYEGKKYAVGVKTGRVYEDTDNRDIFQGFVGVGKFKTMKMP
jgi:hypothetical protein